MSNWNGYFLKATATDEIFPMQYIQFDSWDSNPNYREEIKAYRDDYDRSLTRITAPVHKSTFAFSTREDLKLEDREVIKGFFDRAMSIENERKINLEYWNDEDLEYKTGDFYIPNINFKIKVVRGGTLVYNSYKLEFIEY